MHQYASVSCAKHGSSGERTPPASSFERETTFVQRGRDAAGSHQPQALAARGVEPRGSALGPSQGEGVGESSESSIPSNQVTFPVMQGRPIFDRCRASARRHWVEVPQQCGTFVFTCTSQRVSRVAAGSKRDAVLPEAVNDEDDGEPDNGDACEDEGEDEYFIPSA